MAAQILDGLALAGRIRGEVVAGVRELMAKGHRPKLAAILVGQPQAGLIYAKSQRTQCDRANIDYELHQLPAQASATQVQQRIEQLNADPTVTGIILLLPLPEGIDPTEMQYRIDRYKDVEGVNPANIGMVFYDRPIIAPCASRAAVELLEYGGVDVYGAEVVVVGQSAVVGRPITLFLLHEMATVTACHIATRDLIAHTKRAEVLITAVGKPNLITADHVKPGAVVIDLGISRVKAKDQAGNPTTRVVGDVDFEAVKEVAAAITPVPGGVGPVTVAMLLANTVEAARKQLARPGG